MRRFRIWHELSRITKVSAVAAAFLVIAAFARGVWSLTEPLIGTPPYASKAIELVVAGLQLESLQAKQSQVVFQILQLEAEQKDRGNKFEAWKAELLQKLRRDRLHNERIIKEIEKR